MRMKNCVVHHSTAGIRSTMQRQTVPKWFGAERAKHHRRSIYDDPHVFHVRSHRPPRDLSYDQALLWHHARSFPSRRHERDKSVHPSSNACTWNNFMHHRSRYGECFLRVERSNEDLRVCRASQLLPRRMRSAISPPLNKTWKIGHLLSITAAVIVTTASVPSIHEPCTYVIDGLVVTRRQGHMRLAIETSSRQCAARCRHAARSTSALGK